MIAGPPLTLGRDFPLEAILAGVRDQFRADHNLPARRANEVRQLPALVSGSCSTDFRALRARTCFKNGRL
jgi:hypothetical protein